MKIFTYTKTKERTITGDDGRTRETVKNSVTHEFDAHGTMGKIATAIRQLSTVAQQIAEAAGLGKI